MKTLKLTAALLLCAGTTGVVAQEPAWNANAIKGVRPCLLMRPPGGGLFTV